jgi:hypothetical protein
MKYRVKVILAFIVLTAALEAGGEKEQFKIMQLEIEQTELIPNIIKNFVAVKMHFKYGTPQATLEKTVARFDQINKTLASMPLDENEKKILAENEKIWLTVRPTAVSQPTKAGTMALKKQLPPLFKNCMKMAKYAQEHTGNEKSKIFLLMGKLTSLPQKFAGMYMSLKHADGAERERIVKEITKYAKMYKESFAKIKTKMGENPLLKKIERDMSFFEFVLAPERTFVPAIVFRKTNAMSNNMKKLEEKVLAKIK